MGNLGSTNFMHNITPFTTTQKKTQQKYMKIVDEQNNTKQNRSKYFINLY